MFGELSSQALTDLARVEVQRGPQGTLAGKNSLGGAIKLYQREPDGANDGYLEATYGRFDRLEFRGATGFTLTDGLYGRISAVHRENNGYFQRLDYGCVNPGQGIASTSGGNCEIGRAGGGKLTAVNLVLRYAPAGSPLTVKIAADLTKDDRQPNALSLIYANNPSVRSYDAANPAGGVPFDSRFIIPGKPYASYADGGSAAGNYTTAFGTPYQMAPGTFTDPVENSAKSYGVAVTADYKLSDVIALKSITAWRHAEGKLVLDTDGSPLTPLKLRDVLSHAQFTQELRLSANLEWADATLGGFYYKAHDRQATRLFFPTSVFNFQADDPVETVSKAVFAHLELHPTSRFNIIFGARYTEDKKSYRFGRTNPDGSAISGIPLTENFLVASLDGLTSEFKGNRFDYRIGLNYKLADEAMVYAQVSTGFKGGGTNPQPFVADQAAPFGPEKLTSYEAGFKTQFFHRALTLNGAVFYNDYNGIQLSISDCSSFSVSPQCQFTTNAGKGHSKGAELELAGEPISGLIFTGSVGYIDFKYDEVNPSSGITLDSVTPFTSKWQLSGGVQYTAEVGPGRLIPRIDWSYRSSFYAGAVNSFYNLIAARHLVDAKLTYELPDEGWSVSGSVTNVFNLYYASTGGENVNALGLANYVIAPPREWRVTLRKTF